MRKLKEKAVRSKFSRTSPKKTTFGRMGSFFRYFLSNRMMQKMTIICAGFVFLGGLLCTKYPQEWINCTSDYLTSITGKIGLRVSDVFVEGRVNAPAHKILEVVDVYRGDPLLKHDPDLIKNRLESVSWIDKAIVKRQWPGIIFIQLKERYPVALWQHQQKYYLVDEKGIVIGSEHFEKFKNIPIIVGVDAPIHAPRILKLLEKFPDIRKKLTVLVRVGGRRWDLHWDKTLQIKLPEMKVEEALVKLSVLMKQKKMNISEVSVIDLRVQNQIVIKLSPMAAVRLKGKGKET